MEKFYKYFTIMVLSMAILFAFYWIVAKRFEPIVSAQEKKFEKCEDSKVIVMEDNPQRAVHVAYNFERGTVSIVQIQKAYNPPGLTVVTKNLGTP